MPIILDDLSQNTVAFPMTKNEPKFFHSKLTGSGKKLGIINDKRNPIYIDPKTKTKSDTVNIKYRVYTQANTTVYSVPFNLFPMSTLTSIPTVKLPDTTNFICIGSEGAIDTTYYLDMKAHSIILEETKDSKNGMKRDISVCYEMDIWAVNDAITKPGDLANVMIASDESYNRDVISAVNNTRYSTSTPQLIRIFTENPLTCYEKIKNGNTNAQWDDKAFLDYLTDYSLYDAICAQAEEWQERADIILDDFFAIAKNQSTLEMLIPLVLRYIETYNIPLELYKKIYASLSKHFPAKDVMYYCKQNMNLLLSDTLSNLDANKQNLTKIPVVNPKPAVKSFFSPEQVEAITTEAPLAIVQAGAGSGKSTVILERINYLIKCGVDPHDITVLSFTNAAADHITEKNPDINSMTIARMIHNIYSLNFPEHELSSIDTIINSLDIYFPHDDFARSFKNCLWDIVKNNTGAFTSMNNFIEDNYDDVIKVLSVLKQTSLELEIIICYLQIEHFQEPVNVQSKFLIIDEVQDNSIFEFIYTLKYVDKHKESLFIVGDCSQTLYEFRASNPKALNILEGSGVFEPYTLQTNYRSNQEILDFANITLQNIEANQYANIRLRANNLNAKVTERTFKNKVIFDYHQLNKINDFNDVLGGIIAKDVKPYIDKKLAKGQQIAFLAFTRRHVNMIMTSLENLYPDKKIVSLVPEKMYNSTIFSTFIKKYWNEVKFIPNRNVMYVIGNAITHRLDNIVWDKQKAAASVNKLLQSWYAEEGNTITAWQNQHLAGTMTLDQLLDNIKENMIQFEIKHNAVKQALLSAKNEENKKQQNAQDADFVLSTIHSAKGLEFENTVVVYRAENYLSEEAKRMYYVALTRAMKSEYIIAYDTLKNPKMLGDYEGIIKNLHERDAKAVAAKIGAPVDDTDDENQEELDAAVQKENIIKAAKRAKASKEAIDKNKQQA